MRLPASVAGIVAAIAVIAVIVWVGRYAPWVPHYPDRWERAPVVTPYADLKKAQAHSKEVPKDSKLVAIDPQSGRPPLATKPPFPKAVVSTRDFNFGTVKAGQEQKHTFRIENKGEGRLLLTTGPGRHSVPWQKDLPAGGFAELEMTWRPIEATSDFRKTDKIWSNDPELRQIELMVHGRVVGHIAAMVSLEPAGEWSVRVEGGHDGKFTGKIGSDVESSFRITSINSSSRFVNAVYRPLDANELRQGQLRSGYAVEVTVKKEVPVGVFNAQLKIHTTLTQAETIDVNLTALQLR